MLCFIAFVFKVYRPSKNRQQYTCDQCVKNYCITCQTEWHEGVTCEEHKKLLAKRRDEQLLSDNLGLLPFKKCPKCGVLIEKYAGCNAVKCTQCSIAFCWLCSMTDPVDGKSNFVVNDRKIQYLNFSSTRTFLRQIHDML